MAYSPSLTSSHYAFESDASSSSSSSPTLDNRSVEPNSLSVYNSSSGTEEVFRAVVKCRKSWKTLKGGKVVWPLHLERALLEGLSLYKPDNSRETLLLGRFPMRNRFISEHILRTTGEKRSAKQVGSRLQQLRDTCGGGRKLQKLLAPCSDSGAPISNRSIRRYASRVPGSPVSTEDLELAWKLTPPSPTIFYINIESDDASSSADSDYINSVDATIGLSPEPRPIKSIKPCLAFVAPFDSSMNAHSLFVVSRGEVVYYDRAPLMPARHGSHEGGALYTCDLVPNYWNMICDSSNPTEFTIHHSVVRESSDSSTTVFSAIYKFRYIPDKVHSPQSAFIDMNSGISAFQETDVQHYSCFNTGDISSSYDSKSWHGLDTLSLTEQRGYASLPATPGSQWDEYGPASVSGSSSGSSSPVTSSFPPHSLFYSSHQM